jgi:uroporphyrinogen-III synthase
VEALGGEVTSISIYHWTLPDDLSPLREAVRRIAERRCDVVLFTTSIQLSHLLEVAEGMGRAAEVRRALADDIVIGSVGPVMDTALADCGLRPDVAPAHPKMAALVSVAAEMAGYVLARKRGAQKGGEPCGVATLSKR